MPPLTDGRIRTGVRGFDEILRGGVIPQRTYLIRGGPGSGKTTLGLHFLINDSQSGSLFVSLGESEQQLRENAKRSGLSMDGVDVLDLSPGQEESGDTYTLLESWDVEGNSIHDSILSYVQEHQPKRILIDSLSQMRYLSADTFLFRKQVMSLLRKLTAEGATIMFTSEQEPGDNDDTLAFLSDGVITLEQTESERQCRVTKLRGSSFANGAHYFSLGDGGITLYPRLEPSHHGRQVEHTPLGSGLPEFDALTHGGIERGTVTLLSGPTGVGKTTLGAQLMSEAAKRHERSVIYSFDEGASTFFARCRQVGLPVQEMIAAGHLNFETVEPLHYNPDEFAARARVEIEEFGTTMVMIDSLSGYQQSVRGDELQQRVHALCRYLVNMGVTVLLINEVFAITGQQARVTEYGLSYLADNIIMLRYIELDSELRKSIGVLKKRAGGFERTLREFEIAPEGLRVGQPFHGLRGILGGVPEVMTNTQDAT
ncbi:MULTISPECIES: ATPase domain-containing protein [Halomonadaceae]|uniref:non-specific serine/threonine protein kinase n=1 Tax=Onishia taeanensis TaxID=284577 RepID=A0A328XY79_9GAMM|nr:MULTISPECIES: ATPase domain-containing protein [Halomonas]RAR60807.1 circadian clock protein KaiC [Halomonas taeanensis]